MIKFYCDMCGKESKDNVEITVVDFPRFKKDRKKDSLGDVMYGKYVKTTYVCPKCYKKITKAVKEIDVK